MCIYSSPTMSLRIGVLTLLDSQARGNSKRKLFILYYYISSVTESSEHKPGTPQGHGKARHVAASKKLGPGHVSHRGKPDVRTNMFLTFRFQDTPGTCDTVGHGSTYSDCSTYGLCATLRQRLEMAPERRTGARS